MLSFGSMTRRRAAIVFPLLVALAACRTGANYPDVEKPRYAKAPPESGDGKTPHTLRLVSFNIERALRVDTAIEVMKSNPELGEADVLFLQEMDDAGTQRVAAAFGMGYVYYPGTLSLKTHRDFGNAVLSRWPIVKDSKILLPHVGGLGQLQRTATAATLDVGGTEVRVYSVHLATMIEIGASEQREQLQAVLADADGYPRVVIGGDMNSHDVGWVVRQRGFAWPTARGPHTTKLGRWDHIFLKGLASPEKDAAGTVLDVQGASDHRPVWAVGVLP